MIKNNSLFMKSLVDANRASKFAKDFAARSRGPVKGIITDVLDPLYQGRVKVVIDSKNGETQYQSDWVPMAEPFLGQLPESLIGTRVNITPTDSDMQRLVVSSIINDNESESYPANTNMTRLPVYSEDKAPPPCKENVGCTIIIEDGPMGWDYMAVCLGRKAPGSDEKKYYWVPMGHSNHIHAGANDIPQQQEFLGPDAILPGEWSKVSVIWDQVLPTTDFEFPKLDFTNFGVDARGTIAQWIKPPKIDIPPELQKILDATGVDI